MPESLSSSNVVSGEIRFVSRPFSNRWWLMAGDQDVAELRRIPRDHVSEVELTDGTRYRLEPEGWGTVVAVENGAERGRIIRRSWWGRAWDLISPTFGYALTSDLLPRRWSLRVGNEPVGRLEGTLFSYNRLRVHADVGVPVLPLVMSWHVLARPWEAAAAPGSLVARPAPEQPTLGVDG
jgi:hypothetical protein